MRHSGQVALNLATAVVFAALVCIATVGFTISIPATTGYFNLGEIVIYTAALLFGPYVGAFAGGIGAAAADMLIAPQFALATLIIKGFEGAIVGFLNKKLYKKTSKYDLSAVISVMIGGLEMVIGYFLFQQLTVGIPAAIVEIPFNIVQMVVGLIVALFITKVILRVLPQLKR